ncbi:MAG: hypothetical protein Q8L27_04950, partial [archaeon]|nr:hypothetical protein [archaeon]
MRILLSKDSKIKLLKKVKEGNNCITLDELSNKLNIKKKTLESWFYLKNSTIPSGLFKIYLKDIIILDKKESNWGQICGGKKGHENLIKKYGFELVKRFNALGGKNGAKTKDLAESDFKIDLTNPQFLEIYGALMGDGWLNTPAKRGKWVIGICGHLKLDKEYIIYCSNILKSLTNRKGYFYERPKINVIEFRFQHKRFFKLLNEKLDFPAGQKENLIIPPSIYNLGFDKIRYVIRGIFDTDGSFFLDKNSKKIPVYPIISIH